MKPLHLSAITLTCLGLPSIAFAGLSLTCIKAVKAINQLPGSFVEHMQSEACGAGCEPKLDDWPKYIKDMVIGPMFEDALKDTGYAESKEAFVETFDKVFHNINDQCSDKLEGNHFCAHPEKLKPFMRCAQKTALSSALSASKSVYPYFSDSACKRAAGYFTSSKLWDVDFPKHFKKYVHQCHEL
ncbi:uncharacterized protein KD926_001592 [Aspergillus affinis]|uniref:uncharacterized protein n=1 Tax=Aspergillus affinis TaxID=1070780 RepID=UPI0022FE41EB|nr:uncharacterized protein KD926_001592 [Aspergillus affinis]KAI9036639.1 hypothetical protein KD926_001592 [Aspergillus affinis]